MRNRAQPLLDQAARRPDKPALVFGDRGWTFAQWRDEALCFASGLRAAGFGRGSTLGLMLSSRPEFLFVEYAAFLLGGTVVPINVQYRTAEIEHVLLSCDVSVLVTEAPLVGRIGQGVAGRYPRLRHVFVFDGGEGRAAETLRSSGDGVMAPVPVEGDDVALLLCTSATTGRAKGVMLTVANLEANYDPTPEWVGFGTDDVILGALPLYNTFALNHCINAPPVTGATLVLLPRFEERACLDAIARHRCTYLPAVPTMLQKMLNHPDAARADLSSFRRTLVGGAPVPAALLATAHARVGTHIAVLTGYGLTEATALVTLQHVTMNAAGELDHARTIGRGVPGVAVAILDDAGDVVPAGVVGEICVRGPNVMKGYYKLPAETAAALAGGWLHTGDLGHVDGEGYVYIVDRKKDLVIRGGQNVYPAEVEAVLYEHPAVAEVAVVGRPDDVLGEVPVAFVALKPSAVAKADELVALCRERLAPFKVPVSIEVLAELPKGPTGKILRRALKPRG
jgi:long-chain acyl-CoA synthetase